MSATKTALKAAKAALDAHKYQDAIEQARKVLAADPQSYHANVFLGLGLDKQDKNDDSAKAYKAAIQIKQNDPLAWQGLITLYEKQAGKHIDDYQDAAVHLAELFMEADDKHRCQSVVDKFTGFVKKHGNRTQCMRGLSMLLPTSSLYDYLEGRIPHPASTYIKLAEMLEAEEKEKINREIGGRRTRLGAKIGQVTTDVKREVLESSNLEHIYSQIIDWTQDDDTRRQYEEKLLQRAYDTLVVLPMPKKAEKRHQVETLAKGLVILKHPFELAWKIVVEWKDGEELDKWDAGILREQVEFFPDSGLSKVLKAYMESEISPFPHQQNEEKTEEGDPAIGPLLTAEDRLLMMIDGIQANPPSALAHRLMGEYYLYIDEYESAADIARKGIHLLVTEAQISGLALEHSLDAVNISLATALVQYQSPRHHPEARALFDDILRRKPTNTSALVGVGLILEDEMDYTGAIDFLSRALRGTTDPKVKAEAAWCKALNGDYQTGVEELQGCLPALKESDMRTRDLKSQTLYRIGECIWNLDASTTARKDRKGAYEWYLSSLQANMNYAPAYTSLGIYYADYARDKKRARKCFQKAFELSASEVEAAERLAKAFADQGEWDLVEAVAQRVVESGKVKPAPGSKRKGISWPYAALGVVQLNRQDYAKSIVSFQSALRISSGSYHCWVGLGESYHNSGRYIAATKAFEHAQAVEARSEADYGESSWFSEYMLANVKRELGDFEQAIDLYQKVLDAKPSEFGVSITLLQTIVDDAWRSVELGFFGRAAKSAARAFQVAKAIAEIRPNAFNLWKAVGDACSIFTWVQAYVHEFSVHEARALLENGTDTLNYELLADIDGMGQAALQSLSISKGCTPSLSLCLTAAILSHKRAIHACANDSHAQAVAWYNLGWAEYRAHKGLNVDSKSTPKRKASKYSKASVQCFKRAIELEAGNSEFWNSLGVVTTHLNPKVAQHALVRSLFLNDKSAKVWANLGTFYLLQNDFQLANDAFTRAQSTDPTYAHSWLGQGLLAHLLGEAKEAHNLYAHAFEIADSASPIIKRQYACSSFDQLVSAPISSSNISSVLQPLFALQQLRCQVSVEAPYEHLSSLLSERIGSYTDTISSLQSVCLAVESEYEVSESTTALLRFAQAKADLARAQLAGGDYTSAAESAQTALDLSGEETEAHDSTAHLKCRLSAHLTAGLAYYHHGSMDPAIEMFRTALEETDGDPDIVCLLAQVLWAKGGEEERNIAREQLFDCVEKHPSHINAITLLGVTAVLDDDEATIEAVTADLQALRTHDGIDVHQQRKVGEVLAAIATLGSTKDGEGSAEVSEATTAVMLAPSQPHGWSQLADLADEPFPAEMALLTALKAVPPRGLLAAEDLCEVYAGTNRIADAQRAIAIAPWRVCGWEALSPA
ncbi:Tetratricopeptide-like helical domain [Lasallia pustulata]|uniref:Tetratricopeptide-like helical domain n=1 Tax=Lasallia pustulata TaxID=136370 RepID=A0A1W5D1S1_9LECA|nr:Tetratricopeptide-like helical domain [Lasallia pustulata]